MLKKFNPIRTEKKEASCCKYHSYYLHRQWYRNFTNSGTSMPHTWWWHSALGLWLWPHHLPKVITPHSPSTFRSCRGSYVWL
jgi:hypothetical protein